MIFGYTELPMYPAPDIVQRASERWLQRTLAVLGAERLPLGDLDLHGLFRSPHLLLTQTCGYPLVTELHGQVRLVGRPDFDLPHSGHGEHCSLLVVRENEPGNSLESLRGCRGAANSLDSNTGMNLFRHALAPWQRDGSFFASLQLSGSHRLSLRWLRDNRVDLIAVDSVTFAYLALYAPDEIAGLRILQRSATSPALPYITVGNAEQAEQIRSALNLALREEPEAAQVLRIRQVLSASEADYQVLLGYEREAAEHGLPRLHHL